MEKDKILKELLYPTFQYVGDFKTRAGINGVLYPDLRALYSYPKKRRLIIKALVDEVKSAGWQPNFVVGLATAGIVWAHGVAEELNIGMGYMRGEVKDMQLGKQLEGEIPKNSKVLIIDDATSSSKSKKNTVEAVQKLGHEVVGVAVFLNALGGDPVFEEKIKWLKELGYCYVLSWAEIIEYYGKTGFWSQGFTDITLEMIKNFHSNWTGVLENRKRFKELAFKEKNLIFDKSFYEL